MAYVDITSSGTTIRINYNYSYSASADASTISITKLQISSTSYTGTYYPSGEIKIGSTVVIDMDSYYGTHSVYIGYSNGTLYDVSGSVGSTTIKHSGAMAPTFTFTCNDVDGVSASSGKTIWTVNGSKTVNAYKVAYNANGGSGAPATQAKLSGTTLTLSSTKPTKANTTSTSTGTITISYNANGGSSTPSAGTGTYTNTTTTTYAFNNWNTASNGTGTVYNSDASYTANAAATLYAQYTSSSTTSRTSNPSIKTAAAISHSNDSETGYKVTFNANGGSSTPSAITSTKTIKYTFSKWKNLNSGTEFSASTSYTFSTSATLYAQWTSTSSNDAITLPAAIKRSNAVTGTYTITYDANGGACSKTSEAVDRVSSYSFGGWNTKTDGTGTNYNANSSYTPSAATTLYAKWNTTTTTNQTTLPTPTRLGYAFLGWAESPDAAYGEFGSYVPSKNVKLYAIWGALGSVKIKDKDGIHSYVPFIYTNKQWVRAVPFVRTKATWIRAGGD